MAVVRCPRHNIPYNDLNPRGCPACAKEFEGDDLADVMADLARMSRPQQELPDEDEGTNPHGWRVPSAWDPRRWSRTTIGMTVAAVGVLVLFVTVLRGPAMREFYDPPQFNGQVLPLPAEPGQPITNLFAQLGSTPPRAHPEDSSLERYTWDDVTADAVNGNIFSISIDRPTRAWRGLRVGATELEVRGGLALLGTIQEEGLTEMIPSRRREYLIYPSVQNRPVRTLSVIVRPPNGCFDVYATLRPKVIGLLEVDRRQMAVIGDGDTPSEWVLTRLDVVGRRFIGPRSARPAC